MDTFEREMTADFDRLDALFNEDSSMVQGSAVSALTLEYPGLAVVASRSPATRRPVLASIIEKALTATDDAAKESVIVFANATKQLLMREVIAVASGVAFTALDNANLADEDWPKLSHGANLLCRLAGIEEQPSESDDAGHLKAKSRIQWSGNPVAVADVLRALSECGDGSTVIIENAHLLHGADRVSAALSDLRNCAAATGNFLYLGVGLSHWPDVRKSNNRELFLTDLPEAYADMVNIADKILLLAPSSEGAEVTIFDPRYVEAWRGPLEF
ncbi:hypothetical protein H8F21_16030 [Pseudomonas sp. P66]|uniref:Uncharacterized protein n=1 Tax=Pseudomonas arcuscaelestis TaxID=2710591 RepID=A0ABS2BZM5_9PSED|nr:hypothetical protein [Pseudomonas arcuscaelestis]MBM5459078.1 hypothetical protein [Pseudomonas arcuscaelestis]